MISSARPVTQNGSQCNQSCAVLVWAAKRWSHARLLKIDIMKENAEELSQVLACSSKTNDLARLEEVCHVVHLSVLACLLH